MPGAGKNAGPNWGGQHTIRSAWKTYARESSSSIEIGTEEEATACRTIAERGVRRRTTRKQHPSYKPTLSDLLGGVNSVISQMKLFRRGTKSSGRTLPHFSILIESETEVSPYKDIATVDNT